MRKGTVMSMLHTATGRMCAAWLAPRIAQHYIEREAGDKAVVTNISQPAIDDQALQGRQAAIRQRGLERAQGDPLPGIDAFPVPVFDHSRSIALVITSLGPRTPFDSTLRSEERRLRQECF